MHNALKLFAAALVAATAAVSNAAPVIDGTLNVADGYGAPVKVYAANHLDGSQTGETNVVSTYFAFDASKVYGAIHLDSGNKAFEGANVYFYSSGLNTNNQTGLPGVYGDGNDVLAEGANGWGFALPVPPYKLGNNSYSPSTVNYVYNGSDTVEFSIDRGILGDYDSFRYGGQLFAYEFHTGGDVVDGAIVAVPEPTTLAALGAASFLGLGRRRRA